MKRTSNPIAFASCSFQLAAGGEIQLLPAGKFRAIDGRPRNAPCWKTSAAIAAKLAAQVSALANPLVVDYEHQSLLSANNGQPAPAAGWFKDLSWREGEGLFAQVEWTERAKLHIEAGEYKFISPVITYDPKTGVITKIINAALTNSAAIDGMEQVSARLTAALTQQEGLTMDIDELLENLRWMLNLPTLATPEEVTAELQKAVGLIKAGNPDATAAASFSITGLVNSLGNQVAALKSAAPDPAKFVPVDTMQALQNEVAALRSAQTEREVGEVVTGALTSGKLLPAQEGWARELGKSNIAALRQYVETAQPIDALTGTQTGGKPPAGQPEGELSETQLAMCRSMGVDPEGFKKTLADTAVAV